MNFWQGLIIGVIVTQIIVGIAMVKAGIIGNFVAYLESGLTKRAADGLWSCSNCGNQVTNEFDFCPKCYTARR